MCLAPSTFDASTHDDNAFPDFLNSGDADCDTKLSVYTEVHVVEQVTTGGGVAKTLCKAGGPSQLQHDFEMDCRLLSTPIAPGAYPTTTAAELEKMR